MSTQDAEQPDPADDSPVQARKMDRGVRLLDILNRVVPAEEEWESKTIHDVGDPGRSAALDVLGQVIPHVAYQQDTIDEWKHSFLKQRPSRRGDSNSIGREDVFGTIQAAFGGKPGDDDHGGSLIVKGMADDSDD